MKFEPNLNEEYSRVMKKLLLLLILILASFSTFAQSDIDFTLSNFCYEQLNVQDRNGVYYFPNQQVGITDISICVFKNANGQYHSKGRLLDGKKDGQWIFWNRDGTKWIQEYWNKGLQEKHTGWYGNLRFEATYKNGIRATNTTYDSNERILEEGIHNTPEYKSYIKKYSFHDNGNLQSSYTQIDVGDGRVTHGKSESWYEDGQKREEIDYKYGEMGNWTEWYDNGQMSLDIPQNDDGEFHGTLRWWYYNGMLAQVSHYSNGEILTEKGFDETGKCIQGDCDE